MKLTMDMLLYLLEREYTVVRPEGLDGRRAVDRVRPWIPGRDEPGEALLLPGRTAECGLPDVIRVAARDLPEETPRPGEIWLLAPESSYESVLYRAMDICDAFTRMSGDVTEQALGRGDLRSALALMRDSLGISLSVVDSDYLVVESLPHANEEALRAARAGSIETGRRMDAGQIEDLYLTDPRFDETFVQQGIRVFCRYDYPGYQGLCLYYNFFLRGRYAGRLVFLVREDVYSDCLLPLLEDYGRLICDCFCARNDHSLSRAATAVHRYLLDYALDGESDAPRAAAAFWEIGWRVNDSYRAICLSGRGYARSETTLAYLCTLLEDAFPACVAACRDQTIYCLHNRSREPGDGFSGKLAVFLRENLLQAGLSCVYDSLETSGAYFREAAAALRIGEKADDSFWLHYFHDHTLTYTLDAASAEIPAEDLYCPTLKKLLAFDREHPELPLTETLAAYIACRYNATRAAEKLFIHRTTFLYRMDRLRQLVTLDLDDPEAMAELVLSFAVWRREREKG